MENYLVSARKYRPDTFMSVVGQKALTTTLQNAIKNQQLAHAYLFCGPRGVGKTTCARIFAKAINCMNLQPNGEACNECESCRSFNEQRSFNIHELDAASNNSVDDIRELTDQVRIPPQIGKYKVYIIDEVHMLSTAAFNAFLKTLEEPPAHAIFILATTEKHKIIPTILSRCQIYDFHRIGINDIQEYLQYVAQSEHIEYEPEALNIIAMKADGGMRDALSIFDQVVSFGEGKITYKNVIENLNVLDYDYYFRLIDMFLQHRVSEALLLFDEVLNQGFEGQHFIAGLCTHLRDLMVCKDPRTLKLLEVGDSIRNNYQKQSGECSFGFLFSALKIANECSLQYNQSKNKRLLIELCLIRLCQGDGGNGGGGNGPDSNRPPLQATTRTKPTESSTVQPTSKATAMPTATATAAPAATAAAPVATPTMDATTAATAPAATVSATTPVPKAPQPQKTAPKTAKSMPQTLSIKGRKAELIEVAAEQKEEAPITEERPFTQEELIHAWQEFAQTIQDDPQLSAAMIANEPHLLDENTFEFVVYHINLKNRLSNIGHQIEQFLQKELHNGNIRMSLRISEGEENKKALAPEDKLNAMIEKNPTLRLFKQQLKLNID